MTDQVADTGLQRLDPLAVVLESPAFLEVEGVGVEAVEDREALGLEQSDQPVQDLRRPLETPGCEVFRIRSDGEDGNPELRGQLLVALHEGGEDDGAHVAVEVGHVDPRLEGHLDLGAKLDLHLFGLGPLHGLDGGAGKESLLVQQGGNRRAPGDRAPAVVGPLGVQREMHAQVEPGARLGELHGLLKPRARHHDAAAGRGALPEYLEGPEVRRMTHSNVIGVDDGYPIGGSEAQTFGECERHGASLASLRAPCRTAAAPAATE